MAAVIEKKTANILSLNDKCLDKIFNCLKLSDCIKLVKAYEERLRPIFRNTLIKGRFRVNSSTEDFENIVHDFGAQLTHVSVGYNVEWINLLSEFCLEGKLQSLELTSVSITDPGMITRLKTMLSQLMSLKMVRCEISDANLGRLLGMCPQLETLLFETLPNSLAPLLRMTSTNMKSISLYDCANIDRSTLIQLLTKYPNLRRFYCYDFHNDTFPYNDVICQMLSKLEQHNVDSDGIGHAIALNELKDLTINLHIDHLAEVNSYLSMSPGLNFLKIECDFQGGQQLDGLIDAICLCTSLQKLTLELRGSDVLQKVMKFAESLPSLRSIYLNTSSRGDSKWHQKLWLEFIEKAKQLVCIRAADNTQSFERECPDLTDFTENLRNIVRGREQNQRELKINLVFPLSYQGYILGSNVVYRYPS